MSAKDETPLVLITGGSRGIGRGIAEAYLRSGARVVVCGRTAPNDAVSVDGNAAEFVATDVRDAAAVDAMFDFIEGKLGLVHVLINNAGGAPMSDAATASSRLSEKVIALNLLGALHCSQRANRTMQSLEHGGVIINIASVSGLRPSPGTAAYGAAKAGLLSLTESLAIEWAPKVRVNAVSAGFIQTELAHLHYGSTDGIARVAKTVPLGRLGTPQDIADACMFLTSNRASYISGANLVVHGGGERPAFLDAADVPPPERSR